jgi:hypothetical protein
LGTTSVPANVSSLQTEVISITKLDTYGFANYAVKVDIQPIENENNLIPLSVTIPVFAADTQNTPEEARKILFNLGNALVETFGATGSLE